ncbi:MAG: ribosomal protein S18-alanine N-acetyltransferase [Lachnospiraceae bacterium]|nr:ribosomal protein S18-alanine N-acetyltransferase [Lachnospiraceae bacterium]
MEIRRMQERDLDQVAALEQEIFSEPWSRQGFADSYQKKENCYLVVEEDGQVLAYCGLWSVLDEADICNVAVRKEARRRGVAEAMLKMLILEGKKLGVAAFTLEVRIGNTPAVALYRKLGFRDAGVRPGFYTKPDEDALIMWYRPGSE